MLSSGGHPGCQLAGHWTAHWYTMPDRRPGWAPGVSGRTGRHGFAGLGSPLRLLSNFRQRWCSGGAPGLRPLRTRNGSHHRNVAFRRHDSLRPLWTRNGSCRLSPSHSALFTHCCHNNGHFLFFPVYLGQENKICSGKGDVPLGKEDYR